MLAIARRKRWSCRLQEDFEEELLSICIPVQWKANRHFRREVSQGYHGDMRQCNTAEDLVQVAYDHLDTISPRGIAAFWSLFVKHLHNHYETSQCKLIEQLNAILYIQNMSGCGYIDIATIAISLAKIMKQVEFRGQRATTGSLH